MEKYTLLNIDNKKFDIYGTFGANSSSKGMLYKWTATLNNQLIYIKTGLRYRNTYSDIQPLTEALVSDILHNLGINHVRYYYTKLEKSDKIFDVCYSYDFAKDSRYITMREFVGNSDIDLYTYLIKELNINKKELDTMIIVDFIINNIDRHLRNFGMLEDESKNLTFAPLFDHGFSLYGDKSDEELQLDSPEDLELVDDCKPFKNSHYEQIKLVSDIHLKVNLSELLKIVDSYRDLLKPHRINCIKYLLKLRIEYLIERGVLYE
ncbi:hypothetical protein [Clostridioides difficile]|uniref:hypothetical protein n=1 Tax=Clostridioides TaxID=1870884 RepID=UPI000D1F310F|nr:hypothetical protein [Clostridioides difficile]MCC0664587.1 hypothetical protein [Clostridioides sp. ZZV15-6597]HBE9444665.1 hypothetical protein [Clostridioides difficile]HBF1820647.1 hypothetical protein [Clostridioides difficile]